MSPPVLPLGPLFVDVAGLELAAEERDRLSHPLVGGVILFERNCEAQEQLVDLVRDIERIRTPGLLTAVDQEGGRVQRFRRCFTALPPARTYGKLYDRDPDAGLAAARDGGWVMAAELRAVGIDFSFAPVLDLGQSESEVIGDRAFHADPDAVSCLAAAFIDGMRRGGMRATGKHFPGHGGVAGDSHLCLPSDPRRWAQIDGNDLVPYRALHGALGGVMTAHVMFPEVDSELPTYSRYWLRKVLRDNIGFRGIVFSDDLSMAGAGVAGGLAERVTTALCAGCDMALVCNDPGAVDALLDTSTLEAPDDTPEAMLALRGGEPERSDLADALATVASLHSLLT